MSTAHSDALVAAVAEAKSEGAAFLDDLVVYLRRYVAFPSDHALNAVALWGAHTHAVDAFDSSPRLALLSPEPASGKTRTLEVLEFVVPNPMHALSASPAPIFRSGARLRTGRQLTGTAAYEERGKDACRPARSSYARWSSL